MSISLPPNEPPSDPFDLPSLSRSEQAALAARLLPPAVADEVTVTALLDRYAYWDDAAFDEPIAQAAQRAQESPVFCVIADRKEEVINRLVATPALSVDELAEKLTYALDLLGEQWTDQRDFRLIESAARDAARLRKEERRQPSAALM
ncbi:hypothetical protein [Chelatococcus asaccharovorans]|uniref:Uncharacterized protein n=1 Tax=Chelatococcus asaccharovorans TaxID=28210 RepID=A0A2V3U3W5_9HYPH|nr:hypothetical protein [Chelatococcus asaccharovorans]MBS7702683.1 hypothetical protein [Chelatococcus asaccharovorans]PXW56978.1 hypothetical protein C7450_10715 [Chelatococcus asaccharovorans]